MIAFGFDPGMDGGLACIVPHEEGLYVSASIMPFFGKKGTKRDIDALTIFKWINTIIARYPSADRLAVIELVHSMAGQGVSSSFKFGKSYGQLLGAIACAGIPIKLVSPQKWKKEILSGTKKDKQAAINFVKSYYPEVNLRATPRCTTDHDGIADAVCMAAYAKKLLSEG